MLRPKTYVPFLSGQGVRCLGRTVRQAADAVYDRTADSLAVTAGRRPSEVRRVIGRPIGISDSTWMRCLSRSVVATQSSVRPRFLVERGGHCAWERGVTFLSGFYRQRPQKMLYVNC